MFTSQIDPTASAPGSSGTVQPTAHQREPQPLPKDLDRAWHVLASHIVTRRPRRRRYLRRARRVLGWETTIGQLTEDDLQSEVTELRAAFGRKRERRRDVYRAFAVIREIAGRRLGLRPYREQIAAGLAMYDGTVVELATGEGKTLAAVMPAVLLGWRCVGAGGGCHLVTVNDYLAERDASWMTPIYEACGVRVAHVVSQMDPAARQRAYAADVTYTTSREVAADFLRSRLRNRGFRDSATRLLRGIAGQRTDRQSGDWPRLRSAIVDEADSILIDEAVTPLLISGQSPNKEQTQAYEQAAALAGQLAPNHYQVDQRRREVRLTASGQRELARLCEHRTGLWQAARRREELISQALTARELFLRESHYVIQDEKIVIVDEFTGRLMPDRTWRDGLHQAVEAKENLPVNAAKSTLARMSFQRFFRHYEHLAGMTGTCWEARRELWQTYRTPTVRIPTHRPCIRRHHGDRVFKRSQSRWQAVADEVKRAHDRGRPVLIGTRSVGDSERLSALLDEVGLEHEVLNAVRHEEEAAIVARAGRTGRITVATNMAGRGTDIKPDHDALKAGGLHVIATQRHEAGRIDRQLAGRAARQGQPGSAIAFVCLEDELVRRHGPLNRMLLALTRVTRPGWLKHAGLLPRLLFRHAQASAQRTAQRRRRAVVRQDEQLDETLSFAAPAYRD